MLRFPVPERFFGLEDDLPNGQDQPKTAPRCSWRATFFVLEHHLFFPVWGAIWGRFWSGGFFVKKAIGFDMMLCTASRWPKAAQGAPRDPKTSPRDSKRLPRAPQEASKPIHECPRGPQKAPKTTTTSRKKAAKMLEIDQIVGIDQTQRPCSKSQNEKGGRAAAIPVGNPIKCSIVRTLHSSILP